MSGFKMPSWSARNPLGIVALFISLIYGISALLLGTSVGSLLPHNQDRLVFFIVLFPVAVLAAFLWLVSRHHRKLYGPGDFRSDEGFFGIDKPSEALGEKYIAESEAEPEDEQSPPLSGTVGDAGLSAIEGDTSRPAEIARTGRIAQAYLLEGLVFQELQKEMSGSVRREVVIRLPTGLVIQADGVIETPDRRVLVEVVHARRRKDLTSAILSSVSRVADYGTFLQDYELGKVLPLVAVIVYDNVSDETVAERLLANPAVDKDVAVRIYKANDLLTKYGVSRAAPPDSSAGSVTQ